MPTDADLQTAFYARGDREKIPRWLLRAIFGMLVLVLALVSYARLTDMPLSAAPPTDVAVVKERVLHIYGDISGEATVLDAGGSVVADLSSDEGGFVAGVWRALALKRRQAGVDPNAPVRLIGYADGRIQLRDPATGWRAELIGFGEDNREAFARLLK
jgi:putative photosynthetic complex assembly protein